MLQDLSAFAAAVVFTAGATVFFLGWLA